MGIDRVRWGIVATGNISTQFTHDLGLLPDDAVATAVASRSQDSANKFAAEFGIPHAYDDYRRLIDSGEVDVIYIGTPHPQHYAIARTALQAGIAVLCEKPVTLTAAQARDLIAVAARAQHAVRRGDVDADQPGRSRRSSRTWPSGVIGEPQQVVADFAFSTSLTAGPPARSRARAAAR